MISWCQDRSLQLRSIKHRKEEKKGILFSVSYIFRADLFGAMKNIPLPTREFVLYSSQLLNYQGWIRFGSNLHASWNNVTHPARHQRSSKKIYIHSLKSHPLYPIYSLSIDFTRHHILHERQSAAHKRKKRGRGYLCKKCCTALR